MTVMLVVYVLLLVASGLGLVTKDYRWNGAGLAAGLLLLVLTLLHRG
jgi:hypothetical protein